MKFSVVNICCPLKYFDSVGTVVFLNVSDRSVESVTDEYERFLKADTAILFKKFAVAGTEMSTGWPVTSLQ